MKNLKFRLIILNFLEFAVWGSYLVSLGNFLGREGLSREIFWFYTVQGIASLFMPMAMGTVADRWMNARHVMSLCHVGSALFKILAVIYCITAQHISFWPLFILFGLSVALYIPTIGIGNALVFGILRSRGLSTVKQYPALRLFGTVGFITAMLLVNFIHIGGLSMQQTVWQLALSALFGIGAAIYVCTLPSIEKSGQIHGTHSTGTGNSHGYLKLLSDRRILVFLIFAFLISVCLQITNTYANSFISSFVSVKDYADSWGARNANAIIAVSQVSETLCILLIPVAMKFFGIKRVLIISAMAWALRFGFLGIGNPSSGIVWFLLSMIIYGIAFDFLNIAGSIYLDSCVAESSRNRVQGLFMLVMSGLGATVGTPLAGLVVNRFVFSLPAGTSLTEGWQTSWFIFAAYSVLIALAALLFYPVQTSVTTMGKGCRI